MNTDISFKYVNEIGDLDDKQDKIYYFLLKISNIAKTLIDS